MQVRLTTIGLAAVLLVFSIASAKQQATAARAEGELVSFVREWLAAEQSGNRAALDKIIADDFVGSAFGGNVISKSNLLPPDGVDSPRFPKSILKEATARAFGSTGVVMGRIGMENPTQPGHFRFALVFMKRTAGWQMVAAQLARVELPES